MSRYAKDQSDDTNIDDFRLDFNICCLSHLFTTFGAELTFGLILFIINLRNALIA
jgi:hypothetical protein